MQHKLLHDNNGQRTFAIVLELGDEVMSALQSFVERQHITAAQFTAIGALSDADGAATLTELTARTVAQGNGTTWPLLQLAHPHAVRAPGWGREREVASRLQREPRRTWGIGGEDDAALVACERDHTSGAACGRDVGVRGRTH